MQRVMEMQNLVKELNEEVQMLQLTANELVEQEEIAKHHATQESRDFLDDDYRKNRETEETPRNKRP